MVAISYVILLLRNISVLNSGDLLLSKRSHDRRTRGPKRIQPNWHISVDSVEATASPDRVAATAAKDQIIAVAMGHLIVSTVRKHIVVAAHRTDVVVSRAAKNPIGAGGALAHMTTLAE